MSAPMKFALPNVISVDAPPCFDGEKLDEHALGLCVGRCVHDMLNGQCSWCQGLDESGIRIGFDFELQQILRVPDLDDGAIL